jgi:hypothetical protein
LILWLFRLPPRLFRFVLLWHNLFADREKVSDRNISVPHFSVGGSSVRLRLGCSASSRLCVDLLVFSAASRVSSGLCFLRLFVASFSRSRLGCSVVDKAGAREEVSFYRDEAGEIFFTIGGSALTME